MHFRSLAFLPKVSRPSLAVSSTFSSTPALRLVFQLLSLRGTAHQIPTCCSVLTAFAQVPLFRPILLATFFPYLAARLQCVPCLGRDASFLARSSAFVTRFRCLAPVAFSSPAPAPPQSWFLSSYRDLLAWLVMSQHYLLRDYRCADFKAYSA